MAPRSWFLPSVQTTGNHNDWRAKPGEGIRCCVWLQKQYVCSLPPDLPIILSSLSFHPLPFALSPLLLPTPLYPPTSLILSLLSSLILLALHSSPLHLLLPFPLPPLSPLTLPSSPTVEKVLR
ncbi:unnamed protein product [Schistocephalus solidus]|uniref:Uncharacterized protein n=1 Tax=Schistocephalus solidus TaxID=70667 RepID=A0A183SYA7_SCHSO|nr:unnamed protein product [Schistocephalus solidus]